MRSKQLRRTTILTVACVLFLAGIGFARLEPEIDSSMILLSVIFFGAGIILSRRTKVFFVPSLLFLAFSLGWWRGAVYMQKIALYDEIFGKTVVFEAEAREDAVYSKRSQLTFSATNIKVAEPFNEELVGNIEVEGFGSPMVYRGDIIRVEGKLFRKRGDNQAGVSFANVTVLTKNNSKIENIRRQFVVGLQNTLPEPLASFGLGLLIGQRNTLPEALSDELTRVGLVHIVAVSGYNLTVIIHITQRLLAKRSRFQSFVSSLALIGLFLLFTGYSPSIVRAAVVSILGLSAWFMGRKFKPMLLLLLSAVLTVGAYPLYLWSSVGWYLSFMAFYGVLILAPLMQSRLLSDRRRQQLLPMILSETLAAQICTLPIILFIFGRLSVVSIVANILVVPFVPLAMLGSVIAGLYGSLGGTLLSGLIALPARILLEYMLSISTLLSRLPFANIEVAITAVQMVIMFGVMIVATLLLARFKPKSRVVLARASWQD